MICSAQTPRSVQLEALYPQGVPGLWCRLITHRDAQGHVDLPRMQAQLAFLRPHVQGFVLFDDDATLDRAQRQRTIDWALQTLRPKREFLLIASAAVDALQDARHLADHADNALAGLLAWPALPESATQGDLVDQITPLLRTNVPIAIKQPDASGPVCFAAQTLASLAARHENLLYFADASGQDAIARSGLLPAGVFRFRMAEGHYTDALASTGGPYHGLMSALANVFPQQMARIVLAPALGEWNESRELSSRLTRVIDAARCLAQDPHRAIRAIDHLMAHGRDAMDRPAPACPDGDDIRPELLQALTQLLAEHELWPGKGYLP